MLALVLAGQAAAVAPVPAPHPPIFRTEVGLVILQATVKNPRGELITDLDRSAFTVYENGKAQVLTLFHRVDVPVSLGLAIDDSGSMRRKRQKIAAAALALVRASNPMDEVFVLSFGDKPRLDVPFTRDVATLERGIVRTDSIGGTALRDAIATGEEYLATSAVHARKVLLVVTDGKDNASVASAEGIRRQAERSETAVYAIVLLDDDEPKAGRRPELDELAEATGGVVYYPRSLDEVGGLALDLARQIRSQYTIGYSPSNQALDGSYRKLRVVAKGRDRLIVRTREGYRATSRGALAPLEAAVSRH